MSYVEKLCTKCCHLLGVDENDSDDECDCGGRLIPLELAHDDYITLCKVWSTGNEVDYTVHWDLYNAMVELKKNDIIEYNLKMSQFRTQVNQQKQQRESNTLKCPICGSANIKKITLGSRAVKTAVFGVIGAVDDAGKTYKCDNCESKF